jgi:hypothetical protein
MSFQLPRFKAALAKFSKELPAGTFWRYSNGHLPPPFGALLVENPELAEALAEDARALASGEAMLPQGRGAAREAA